MAYLPLVSAHRPLATAISSEKHLVILACPAPSTCETEASANALIIRVLRIVEVIVEVARVAITRTYSVSGYCICTKCKVKTKSVYFHERVWQISSVSVVLSKFFFNS